MTRPLFLRDDLPHASDNGKPKPPSAADRYPPEHRGDAYEGSVSDAVIDQAPPPDGPTPTDQTLQFPEPIMCSQLTVGEKHSEWLLHGYIMDRSTTMLSALWKSGKTTWLAHLLRAFGDGSGMFCGRVVLPSNVLIVTEEPAARWVKRRDDLGLGDHLRFIVRPFKAKPTLLQWQAFITHLVGIIKRDEIHLVIFDTLSSLWPVHDENDAGQVTSGLLPLHGITEIAALMLVHHIRKSDGGEATASRGSGALPAFVDTIIELRRHDANNKTSCKRVLTAYGRWDETPPEVVIELDQAAKEYRDCGDRQQDRLRTVKDIIRGILPRQRPGMTYQDIRAEEHWPDRVPTKAVILDALQQGTEASEGTPALWIRDGTGKKGSPFTYLVQEA